jgi:hypothetical protein
MRFGCRTCNGNFFTEKEKSHFMFDIKNLDQLKKLDESAPDTMKAFWAFDKETFKEGSVDVLHKQLMAVAVALTTVPPLRGGISRPPCSHISRI